MAQGGGPPKPISTTKLSPFEWGHKLKMWRPYFGGFIESLVKNPLPKVAGIGVAIKKTVQGTYLLY